jgi:hypothetical protein
MFPERRFYEKSQNMKDNLRRAFLLWPVLILLSVLFVFSLGIEKIGVFMVFGTIRPARNIMFFSTVNISLETTKLIITKCSREL